MILKGGCSKWLRRWFVQEISGTGMVCTSRLSDDERRRVSVLGGAEHISVTER